MKRGASVRYVKEEGQVLERVLITRHYRLAHGESTCLGCGLCADVCPLGAIELRPGAVEEGRLVRRPRPELKAERCNYCGECVVVCPSHSLALTIDGQPHLLVVEGQAFPELRAAVAVDVARCVADCGLACRESCPVEAITVQVEGDEEHPERILAVSVDTQKCFYCGRCDTTCPVDAIAVQKPYGGRVELDQSLCPAGCRVCADACPSLAITVAETGRGDRPVAPTANGIAPAPDDPRLTVSERDCFYCGACARVCPVEGALAVHRSQVRHTEIKSAAWTAALAKILSPALQARELENKARRRTREAAMGLLGIR